jgi:hypothetical protein
LGVMQGGTLQNLASGTGAEPKYREIPTVRPNHWLRNRGFTVEVMSNPFRFVDPPGKAACENEYPMNRSALDDWARLDIDSNRANKTFARAVRIRFRDH